MSIKYDNNNSPITKVKEKLNLFLMDHYGSVKEFPIKINNLKKISNLRYSIGDLQMKTVSLRRAEGCVALNFLTFRDILLLRTCLT